MQCFKGKINIFVKEKALKLNIYSSYFKAYSHVICERKGYTHQSLYCLYNIKLHRKNQ